MKVVILAGGLGTRLQEETAARPKPMVEIGDRPILWHIMKIYASQGFREFVVALGYKAEIIKQYFLNAYYLSNDISISLATGAVEVHDGDREDWVIHLIDTGHETETGGRLKRLRSWLDDGTFLMTYGDGVADIDLTALVAFHQQHQKLATVTAVRPPSRFGGLQLDAADQVAYFEEKPQIGEGWINGGFFVLEPPVFDCIDGDASAWEREPLERIVQAGQLAAYRHEGFWQSMDTLRDVRLLNDLWKTERAPWKIWA